MCADGGQRLAGIEIFKGVTGRHEFVEASQNVVSGDDANPQLVGQSMPGRDHPHSFGTGLGVDAPGVGNDAHVFCQNLRQDAVHQGHEVSGESGLRIPGLLLLHDGHGDFGQIVEHEVVHGAAFDEPHRRFQPVTPEALPASDTNGFHGNNPTFLSGVCHARGMVASWPAGRKHK